jgi:preprotein translocase subunit SecE
MTDKKEAQTNGIFQRIAGWFRKNFRETVGELKKVTWPTGQETVNLTRIVLVVILVMALLLGSLDLLFTRLFALLLEL